MTQIFDAIVELDDRGVLYVHDKNTGVTLLRICRLPHPFPEVTSENQLDITIKEAICNYEPRAG